MGQDYSTGERELPAPTVNRATFSSFRWFGIWPTLYEAHKTAVTVDVLEAGLILAFVMLAFCFYLVLPGIRGKERFFCFIRITLSLFLGACIVLCNWGQEWEVDEIETHTHYKAFTNETIDAHIGIKIGLRNVNITLKGSPEHQLDETINYNERFWYSYLGLQGRIGFGPYAAQINQDFRAAQYKGLPYPILWIAEYFTFDGEGIRWGRNYRTAGWYAQIVLWAAFPVWLIVNILFFFNARVGGYLLLLQGGLMLIANFCWAGIRNFNDLVIPFEEDKLEPHFGWCFWLNIIGGVLSIFLGLTIVVLDLFMPDWVAQFFGIDVLKDYEEFYPELEEEEAPKTSNGHEKATNGRDPETVPEENKRVSVPQFRKRGVTFKKNPVRKPVAPPRQPQRLPPQRESDDDGEGGMELYVNVGARPEVTADEEDVQLSEKQQ